MPMNKNIFILPCLLLMLFFSCKDSAKEKQFFKSAEKTPQIHPQAKLHLDSVAFASVRSSYNGISYLFHDSLYFVDKQFGYIFVFFLDGRLKRKFLGFGKGPNELATRHIDAFTILPGKKMLFLGSSYDYHIHRINGERIEAGRIDWQRTRTKREVKSMSNPPYDAPILYSFIWEKLVIRAIAHKIYFPVWGYIDGFTGFEEKFLKKGRAFGYLNIDESPITVEGFAGRRPPLFYKDYHFIEQFAIPNFDIDRTQNQVFVNYEPDSVIYAYDSNFFIRHAFGRQGRDMQTNYREFTGLRGLNTNTFISERRQKGYYTWLEYIEETKMLFRSYQKSGKASKDGLQVYKNRRLLADVDVPKGFKVLGYSDPWYYSHIMVDERAEKIWVYRFKINE